MKYLQIIFSVVIIALLHTSQAYAQGIGIGTSNPFGDLHIHDVNSDGAVVERISAGGVNLILGYNPSNQCILGTMTNHDLHFKTNNQNRFTIHKNGNIGIGIEDPQEKLVLDGGNILLSSLGATNSKGIFFGESSSKVYGWLYDGLGTGSNNKIHLREFLGTETNILTAKGNGNIGIGEIDPQEKFVVRGSMKIGGSANLTPEEGTIRWNESKLDFEGFDGTRWETLTGFPSQPPIFSVGDLAQGGIVYWVDPSGQHGKVVMLSDLSEKVYSNISQRIGMFAESNVDGQRNSDAIIAQAGHSSSAANLCIGSSINGFEDWYLPGINELLLLYEVKDLINTIALANGGEKISTSLSYWSSTEFHDLFTNVFSFDFNLGQQDFEVKSQILKVRGIRKF